MVHCIENVFLRCLYKSSAPTVNVNSYCTLPLPEVKTVSAVVVILLVLLLFTVVFETLFVVVWFFPAVIVVVNVLGPVLCFSTCLYS